MNRRRTMMLQQAGKGFELVYDAASGDLPNNKDWAFNYWTYGNSAGGTQSMSNSLLNVEVKHAYEHINYTIKDKPSANNCELSVIVNSYSGVGDSSKVGILLTNGDKAIMFVLLPKQGRMWLGKRADSNATSADKKWEKWLASKTSFKIKARLENNTVSVWLDDTLLTTTNNLYDVSELYIAPTHISLGNPWYTGGQFMFTKAVNSIGFAVGGIYKVSNMTYKEW